MSMSYVWVRQGEFRLHRTRDWLATAACAHASTGFMYREYRPGGKEALYVYIDTNTVPGTMYSEATMNQVRNSTDLQNLLLETGELFGQSNCFRWSHLQEKYDGDVDVRVGIHILDCVKAATNPGHFHLYNLCDDCENHKTAHGCVHTLLVNTVKGTRDPVTVSQGKAVRSRRYRPMLSFGFILRPCHRIQTVKSFFQTAALACGFHGFLNRELDKDTGCSKLYISIVGPEGGWVQMDNIEKIIDQTKEIFMAYKPFEWDRSSRQLLQCIQDTEIGNFKTYNACGRCIDGPPCRVGCMESTSLSKVHGSPK